MDVTIARALHVLGVIHWIGGVAMVTLVVLPAVRRLVEPAARLALFEAVENRFARQAKLSIAVVGLSGVWMTHRLGAWGRFADTRSWWMHAMVAVWAVFAFVLFVAEPRFLHAWFHRRAEQAPEETFALVQRAHRVLLAASALAAGAAVLGAHGALY